MARAGRGGLRRLAVFRIEIVGWRGVFCRRTGEPGALGFEHFDCHVADFFEGADGAGEWSRPCVDEMLGIAGEGGFGGEDLHVDVGHAGGGALDGKSADDVGRRPVSSAKVGPRRSSVLEVGDVAVVADVGHEAERSAGGDGLHDPRAILHAA